MQTEIRKSKKWLAGWGALCVILLVIASAAVWQVDPFFHFHAPDTERYYYVLDNQRSQNDGLLRQFDFDGIITGTSMTHKFLSTEMDGLFGTNSIKASFAGGSYREINEMLEKAFRLHPELKVVIRSLDLDQLVSEKDRMRDGVFPSYLYDENSLNDVKYLLNRDVLFKRVLPMWLDAMRGREPGITSFDEYGAGQAPCGRLSATLDGIAVKPAGAPIHLTEEERELIRGNIEQNVTALANAHPEADFYYFFTPYSILWWQNLLENGEIYRETEAEEYAASLILKYPNIHLFCFSCRTDIITDLNNYSDPIHYAEWINSLILRWMHEESYRLTEDNYESFFQRELEFYKDFDYESLIDQVDYEDDREAVRLLEAELTGETDSVQPVWEP